ncbi:phage tail protein [Niallia sp. 01092]|uniref:phage tail protein n=1 Tax=unclassified Niallia TaxID=2837522 RepID=UPI003FD5E354
MAIIGSFAGVAFEVKSKKILTFNESQREGAARWENHNIIGRKPIPEFIGPGLEQFSMTIVLSVYQGVNPEKELDKLRSFRDTGKISTFILGNKSVSKNQWRIIGLKESNKHIDNRGNLLIVSVDVSMEEYPKKSIVKKRSKAKPKKKKRQQASKRKSKGTITIKVGMLNCRSSPSINGKIVKVLRKNQKFTVYGTKNGWYDLGGSKYCSASSAYVTFKKG